MDNEFGKRVLTPILMLVGLVVGIGLIAFSISRILLAVPEIVATFTALLLAGYVLVLAVLVGKRRAISPQALGGGLVVGLVALVGAGIVSAQAGMRELHHDDDDVAVEEAAEPVAEIPDDALLWVAVDIDFAEEVTQATAGEQVIAIDNQGQLPHNVVLVGTDFRVDADGGQQAAASVTLEPGTYEYICDIPGHAPAMSGTLEVN
jgi:plastocyanin